MKFCHAILSAFILFPTLAFSGITGAYHFKGINRSKESYQGMATIEKGKKNVYTIRWVFSDGSSDVGTGVKEKDHISFVFANVAGTSFGSYGVIAYTIKDGVLEGTYALFNEAGTGHEKLTKLNKK